MQMEHFSHDHPLALSKYNNSPADALCCGCDDPILRSTDVYHCIHKSTTSQDSPCDYFFLHKTCAELPMIIQHPLHIQHLLNLTSFNYIFVDRAYPCKICKIQMHGQRFLYFCTMCGFVVCCKCVSVERELNHPSHNHALTLLPMKLILPICRACGTKGREDFSYSCKTCFFWIHESCASAPRELIRKDHDNDHPLVLTYSLPEEYRSIRVWCYLCRQFFFPFYWLYYCAECRYFAHVQCALTAAEFSKDRKEKNTQEDAEGSDLVRLPASENEPHLLYQLIEQFTKKYSISTDEKSGEADRITQCHNGHSLILYNDFNNDNVVEANTSSKRICDGCVLPLLSTPDPFYGCPECNFFLHNVCAAELPREIQHVFHPKKRLMIRLTRYYQTSKPFELNKCSICDRYCNGIIYCAETGSYRIDIVCAALPSKIKHGGHRHTLQPSRNEVYKKCRGCGDYVYNGRWSFRCNICNHCIHIGCALQPGRIKHRWDEHQLILMYTPAIKGHPHAFNCERCSEDINPNFWFYHCAKCDSSFHIRCTDQDEDSNIKYGRIFKIDGLHEHGLTLTRAKQDFKCNVCCIYQRLPELNRISSVRFHFSKLYLKCVACKFSVCQECVAKFV